MISITYGSATRPIGANPRSWVKHLLRKAAARTQAAVSLAIGHLLDSFTAAECGNYFRNSGYASS
jgi:hypothetical protein